MKNKRIERQWPEMTDMGRNKVKRRTASKIEIDITEIPDKNRRIVDLNHKYAKFRFLSVIFCIRCFSFVGGFMFGTKPAVQRKIDSYDNLFLVRLINHGSETEIIIGLHDIYIYGVRANDSWLYFENEHYTIKGGHVAVFPEKYPNKKDFKVGFTVLREAVNTLHHDNPLKWSAAYYALAVNISESVRFDAILRKVLDSTELKLSGKLEWLINNWKVLSKLWIIYCECDNWNPRRTPCEGINEVDAELMLAIVKVVKIEANDLIPLAADDPDADPNPDAVPNPDADANADANANAQVP